jgi:hypothetical protein
MDPLRSFNRVQIKWMRDVGLFDGDDVQGDISICALVARSAPIDDRTDLQCVSLGTGTAKGFWRRGTTPHREWLTWPR